MRTIGSACLLGLLVAGLARAADIASCGTTVASLDTGRLVADLDCTGSSGVQLSDRSTLDMNGHSITGGTFAAACMGSCTVVGPGDMRGATGYALTSAPGRVTVSNVHFEDNALHIDCPLSRVALTDVTTSNGGTLGGSFAIRAGKLLAQRVVVTGDLGAGILASKGITGSDVTTSNNGDVGISSLHSIKLVRLTSTDNVGAGLYAGARVRLQDSQVTGNIHPPAGADIITRRRPRLLNTTCGNSMSVVGTQYGPPWGVCTSD